MSGDPKCRPSQFPVDGLVERCQGLEERLSRMLGLAFRRVGALPLSIALPDQQGESVEVSKVCLPKNFWGWLKDQGNYPNFDAVYARVGHEIRCPRLDGQSLEADVPFHLERWGLAGVLGPRGRLDARLGVEEKGWFWGYSIRRLETISDYVPALCSLDDRRALSAHSFIYKLELIGDSLERMFYLDKAGVLDQLGSEKDDPDISEYILELGGLKYLNGGICGYCGENGSSDVPTLKMAICGSRIHQDCLVGLASFQPDGTGLARCFMRGCKESVIVPRGVMELYPSAHPISSPVL